jgi:hypothetical protein
MIINKTDLKNNSPECFPRTVKLILFLCCLTVWFGRHSVRGATNEITTVQGSAATYPWFRLHPLTATKTNGVFQWTQDDGMDTNVIRQIAHNDKEYHRMVLENPTIYRRQLVYFANSFASLVQNALEKHQGIKYITLPGLDGRIFTVDVTKTDFKNNGYRGRIYGNLHGESDSMVTVAFVNNREAFTIISPHDRIYLQAEAREPGEVIIKSINPTTYGTPPN